MKTETCQLYYESEGKGLPVILAHGFGASLFTWRRIRSALARKYRVICVDLKGFGGSPKPLSGDFTIAAQARHLLNLLDVLGLDEWVLGGHSFGGGVVLKAAAELVKRRPGSLKGLIVINGVAYPQQMPAFMRILKVPLVGQLSLGMLSQEVQTSLVLKECVFNPATVTREMIEGYATPLKSPGSRYAMIQTVRQLDTMDAESFCANHGSIDVPALIVWGRHDRIIPLHVAWRLKEDIPHARLEVLEECGHIPQEEKPEQTRIVIQSFLNGLKS